jgi:Zinc finger, C3HC4 type (RING finger)
VQVCLQSEGEWSLLPCGHAICSPCLAQLIKAQVPIL